LSESHVHELIRPSDQTTNEVEKWLESNGLDADDFDYSPARDWIKFTSTVGDMEKLLQTSYHVFEHDDGSTLVRAESWSLPTSLHKHISAVQPTNSFARLNGRSKQVKEITRRSDNNIRVGDFDLSKSPSPQPGWSGWGQNPPALNPDPAAIAGACNFSLVTPDCLRTLYGTISYTPKSTGTNKMGHTNYLGEYSNRSDAYLFLQKYRPEAEAYAYEFPQISIAGGDVDNGTNTANEAPEIGFEANLDTQTMIGIAWPIPLTVWSTGGRDPSFMPDLVTPYPNSDEPYLVWAQYVTGQPDGSLPQVISTSYGDDEQTVSKSYAQAVCNQFAQLGARGVSVLFASGDAGVGNDGQCFSNVDNTTATFLPSFPNDCPYVTNVGATTGFPEVAAYDTFSDGTPPFTSGAGFSNYFSQPEYQAETVQAYLAGIGNEFAGLYNPKGKNYNPQWSYRAN
jgi:tripeptidyl-peptidase I